MRDLVTGPALRNPIFMAGLVGNVDRKEVSKTIQMAGGGQSG